MHRVEIDRESRTARVLPPTVEDPEDGRGDVADGALSPLIRWRPPTDEEREHSMRVGSQLLDPGDLPDRVRRSRGTPPGRLRTSQAVQGDAQRYNGMPDTSRPWRRVESPRRTPEPLRLGILTDVSGSQMSVVDVTTSLTWILSTAGRDTGVEVASLLFGDEVTSVALPGATMRGVPIPVTLSLSEQFGAACNALNGYLDLDDRSCRRVVVVLSDGGYQPDEIGHLRHHLDRWARVGVRVLWMSDDVGILDELPQTVDSLRITGHGRDTLTAVTHVMGLLGKGQYG